MSDTFSADSLVFVGGRVTIPQYVLDALGISRGHKQSVTFIVDDDGVRVVNTAAHAMQSIRFGPNKLEAAA